MAILPKTRKLLWGCSGGACAMCVQRLTADATAADPPAVLGEECHILGCSPGGPRYGPLAAAAVDAVSSSARATRGPPSWRRLRAAEVPLVRG